MKYEFLDNNIKHEFDAKGYYSVNSGMVFYRQFIDVAFVTEDSIEVCSKSKFLGLIKNKINKSISKNYIIFNYKDIVNDKFITIKILISSANFDKGHQLVEYIKQKLSFEKYKGKEPKNITPEVFYNKLNLRNYVVLDLETTGLSPEKDKVTEFCLIKVKDGKIIDKFCELVNPQMHIPLVVEELTGITNEMVKDKDTLSNFMHKIVNFIDDNVIIGHNVIFDLSFIKAELCNIKEKESIELLDLSELKYIDTLLLVELLEIPTKNYKLETLKKHFKITQESHRAEEDAFTTYKLYEICNSMLVNIKEILEEKVSN